MQLYFVFENKSYFSTFKIKHILLLFFMTFKGILMGGESNSLYKIIIIIIIYLLFYSINIFIINNDLPCSDTVLFVGKSVFNSVL